MSDWRNHSKACRANPPEAECICPDSPAGKINAELSRLRESNERLLEALKEVMKNQQPLRGSTIGERHPLESAWNKARAAIAAAEGEK